MHRVNYVVTDLKMTLFKKMKKKKEKKEEN